MTTPGGTVSVQLSPAQRDYLSLATYLPTELREVVASTPVSGLTIDTETADRFRSAFTDRLAQVGFDSDYGLTDEGALLEELIDAFFKVPE